MSEHIPFGFDTHRAGEDEIAKKKRTSDVLAMNMTIESLLECSVCLELLNERHKVLPCQHTFCTQCLEDISWRNKGELRCPECRTLVLVPISNLPSNIILNRILGNLSNQMTDTSLPSSPFHSSSTVSPKIENPFFKQYPQVWQGYLGLEGDFSKVKLHYLSGLKELSHSVFQSVNDSTRKSSLEAIQSYGATTSKLRIDHYMKNDPELLASLKCRMIQPRDYCVLLALQSEQASKVQDTKLQTLNSLFIGTFRKIDSSGLVHLNLVEGQRSAIIHFFSASEFTENLLNDIAPNLVPLSKNEDYLLVIISRVTLPTTWQSCSGDVSKCSLSNTSLIPTPIMKSILNGTGLYSPYNIAGNLSTNPFVTQPPEMPLAAGAGASVLLTPDSPLPVLPPKSSFNLPAMPPPFLPPKSMSSVMSPAISPALPSSSPRLPEPLARPPKLDMRRPQPQAGPSSAVYHQVYRALYDYNPLKCDELRLHKGQLYIVLEKCEDGWFKGSSLDTLKTGVFPGNYLQHVKEDSGAAKSAISNVTSSCSATSASKMTSSQSRAWVDVEKETKSSDLIDFSSEFMEQSRLNQLHRPPPNVTWNNQSELTDEFKIQPSEALVRPTSTSEAPSKNKSKSFKPAPSVGVVVLPKYPTYITIQEFPSCSDFELELRIGDTIRMMTIRDDGWCKGFQERTGKTGLFPKTFVVRKDS